jgi:hypothetical protein
MVENMHWIEAKTQPMTKNQSEIAIFLQCGPHDSDENRINEFNKKYLNIKQKQEICNKNRIKELGYIIEPISIKN